MATASSEFLVSTKVQEMREWLAKQEFEKGITTKFRGMQNSTVKKKKELSKKQKKEKEKLIKKLESEVNQQENYKYTVRKYQSNSQNQWEKMEFLIDDYRFYAHRPGGMKIKRISDGKTLAILSNKFNIKFKNGGEELFVIKKYKENVLKSKESKIEIVNQVNKLKAQIENNILKKIIPEKKMPGKITLEYSGKKLLS